MIQSWSASRVFQYEECPAKLRYRTVDKLDEPSGPPLLRGKVIHAAGEAYLKSKRALKVPTTYKYVADELRSLRKRKAVSEEQWGFTADWKRTNWRLATIRMVLDAHVAHVKSALVVDFKTGKPRQKDEDQVGLYAAGAFAVFKSIRKVIGQVWYLDLGQIIELQFTEAEALRERADWEKRAQKMMDDTKLEPTPGYYCKWCHFRKSNGGPCKEDQ